MYPIQVISAPSILGLKPTGVELLAETLLDNGLLHAIAATQHPLFLPTLNSLYDDKRDSETQLINAGAAVRFSTMLMNLVSQQLAIQQFPLVLGGDCSVLIGAMAALKKQGNYGLLFLDAHADFYEPKQSTTGELADMDLAIVTGRGLANITNIDGLQPYVKDSQVIHIGQRDQAEAAQYGSADLRDTDITVLDLEEIQATGVEMVVGKITSRMKNAGIDGYWIHFDTDVIDDEENPAVDYRLPGGLSFKDVAFVLRSLMQTGLITGMTVTIFNPKKDPSGSIATAIVNCLGTAFR